eukprot:UN21412
MQNTIESIPIGIFKNVQFWIANDMQKNLNLWNFGNFWLVLFQKSYFFIFFTTCKIPLRKSLHIICKMCDFGLQMN